MGTPTLRDESLDVSPDFDSCFADLQLEKNICQNGGFRNRGVGGARFCPPGDPSCHLNLKILSILGGSGSGRDHLRSVPDSSVVAKRHVKTDGGGKKNVTVLSLAVGLQTFPDRTR